VRASYFDAVHGYAAGLRAQRKCTEVKVLSDGPLEPALTELAESFRTESGHTLTFVYGLSPVIHKKVLDGEVADVVIVQPNFIDELVTAGKLVRDNTHALVASALVCLPEQTAPRPTSQLARR
jgi:ABC-type molybdate transport system substrate-binding protein